MSDAQGTLTPEDDRLGHQTAMPASRVAVADTPEAIFTERYWYMGMPVPAGDLVFGAGLGYYPNRGVMDGYAGVTVQGVQHAFHASRQLGDDRTTTAIGPLTLHVDSGLRSHRIELADNPSGVTLQLAFEATHLANDEGTDVVRTKDGRTLSEVRRFVQMGHYTGWVSVGGHRHVFTRDEPLWGARDRSWGLRMEARTDASHPPVTRFRPLLFMWVCAQFAGRAIHFFLKETAPGVIRHLAGDETPPIGSARPVRRIVAVEHDLRWDADPHGQRLAGGRFDLTFDDGSRETLGLRALPGRFYLKAGLYGGWCGWFQGDDRGPLSVGHVRWDLTDDEARRDLRTLAEQPMVFDLGGEAGYGTIQGGVAAGYPRYTEVQHLPMM